MGKNHQKKTGALYGWILHRFASGGIIIDFMLAPEGIALLSILFRYVSQAFSPPGIVSFLVIGMIAGPDGFTLIADESLTETFGEIRIMLVLFTIGLEIWFETLLKS